MPWGDFPRCHRRSPPPPAPTEQTSTSLASLTAATEGCVCTFAHAQKLIKTSVEMEQAEPVLRCAACEAALGEAQVSG